MRFVQVGIIGAMQRAHPALTQLWLRWTGIPGLDLATFDWSRSERGTLPASQIKLKATASLTTAWSGLCDALGLAPDAEERRRMPIYIPTKSGAHAAFWTAMQKRELTEVDGPLEWWWHLAVLRSGGPQLATKALLPMVFGDDPIFDGAIMSFTNPSLKTAGRTADQVIENGQYTRPTHLVVTQRVSKKSKHEGLAVSLDDDTIRARLTRSLLDLAVFRSA